jgi:hypothetical protein
MFDRNAFATLVSPGFQHKPSTTSLHPLAESVRFGTPAIVRLVCPLWHLLVLLENFQFSIEPAEKAAGFVVENQKRKCYPFAVSHTNSTPFEGNQTNVGPVFHTCGNYCGNLTPLRAVNPWTPGNKF